MHGSPYAEGPAYRPAFAEDRRSDWALTLVLAALFAATLGLYDGYAKGRWGGNGRTMAIPAALEPAAVQAADAGAAKSASAAPAAGTLLGAVQRANQAFAEARAGADAAPLAGAAAGEWLAQEQGYIAQMRARGQTERWRLLELAVVREEVRPDGSGFVCTRERWEAQTLAGDGRVLSTRTYAFSEGYTLAPAGAGWVVTRVEAAEL